MATERASEVVPAERPGGERTSGISGLRFALGLAGRPEFIIQQYLAALASGDLELMKGLFRADAIVNSPLYGTMAAEAFYEQLFARTSKSVLRLKDIYNSVTRPSEWIGYFTYEWTLAGGELFTFDVCDLFRIDLERGLIAEVTIIYDTAAAPAKARAAAP